MSDETRRALRWLAGMAVTFLCAAVTFHLAIAFLPPSGPRTRICQAVPCLTP